MRKFGRIVIYLVILLSVLVVLLGVAVGTIEGLQAQDTVSIESVQAEQIAVSSVVESSSEDEITDEEEYSSLKDFLIAQSKGSMTIGKILRGLMGIVVVLFIAWLFSSNRKAIDWKYVLSALAFQIVLAICLIYLPFVESIFNFVGSLFVQITLAAEDGIIFLFGNLVNNEQIGYVFVFKVLPSIIFFSTISSLLFYWGIIQFFVKWLGKAFSKIMGLSGVESLSLAGNIFLGQIEAPLVVKKYLPNVSQSELFLIMVGGMATMSGGVLAAYIALLGGGDPETASFFARHLLAASVMAAPASVVIGRIVMPQTENNVQTVKLEKVNRQNTNVLDVITTGAIEGMRIVVNVATMLIVFVSLISLINMFLCKIGDIVNINDYIANNTNYDSFSLQLVLGYIMSPIMWLIGVPSSDVFYMGQLIGEKTIINEFVGYANLNEMINQGLLQPKSVIMGVYLMCGFANFGSIGIQIGGIGSLAPSRQLDISRLGIKALVVAAATALLSSIIMGTILG